MTGAEAPAALTLERIFSAPPLGGVLPQALQLSPDGQRVTYLRAADDDRERLDLWAIDVASGEERCLVNAASLARGALTEEEKARRERKRQFAHGIVEYEWRADGESLVFPLDGVVYRYALADGALTALTPPGMQQTDVRLSPDGSHAAYVRDGDLYVYHLAEGVERRLTHDGSGTISHGLAEFVAQEEMHRFEGYWWSPDSRRIAFTRVDVAGIPETYRHDIHADGIVMHPQRYPYAGAANAKVQLCWLPIAGAAAPQQVGWAAPDSEYLARVAWTRDGEALLVQRQDRLQQRLQLVRLALDGTARVLAEEAATHWVNLHDNLHELPDASLLWTSEREGPAQLYRIDAGGTTRRVCAWPGAITRVHGPTADGRAVVVSAWRDDPTALHAYTIDLTSGEWRALTASPGWHQLVLAKGGGAALDTWSAPDRLPRVDVIDTAGGGARTVVANDIVEGHPAHAVAHALAEARFLELAADDGQRLCARLIVPRGFDATRRHPVLLNVYGGPGVSRVHREWLPWWYHFLAAQGVLVFELDNRGSALRGPAFEAPIHRRLGDVEVRDQLVGLDWLAAQPFVDASRIAVSGHSYGGYMTLMLLAKAPGRFACGISTAPVSDWHLYDTHYTERYLGLPEENGAGYAASAVPAHLDALRDPLLLVHGMADDNVLFTHCTQLMKALQDRLLPFELMTYPGAKHGLAERSVTLHRHRLMFDFLRRYLLR